MRVFWAAGNCPAAPVPPTTPSGPTQAASVGICHLDEELEETRWAADRGCRFLEQQSAAPFFLYLSFIRPHSPYNPLPRYARRYADAEIPGIRRAATNELVKKYWEAVGVRTIPDPNSSPLFVQRSGTMTTTSGYGTWPPPRPGSTGCCATTCPPSSGPSGGSEWATWFNTDGADGEAPPPKVRRLIELHRVSRTSMDPDERQAALLEILSSMAENRWIIGTVGVMPQPVIVNAKLRNVPDKLTWVID